MANKVSIQIPTYNQQGFIAKTIESCLAQDYPDLEINIADDCSTDDTYAVVEPYLNDARVRYFKNEKNIGRVANYKKALYEYATGDWAINLDGDDYFTDPSFISEGMRLVNTCGPDIVMYQANHNIKKIGAVLHEHEGAQEDTMVVDGKKYFIEYFRILQFIHCATIYKRSVALKLNFYSYNGLTCDFNSLAKLFLQGKLILSSKNVAHWTKHAANASSTLDEKKINNELAAIDEIALFAKEYFSAAQLKNWRSKMRAYFLYIYLDLQHTAKQKRKALRYLINSKELKNTYFKQSIKILLGAIGIKIR